MTAPIKPRSADAPPGRPASAAGVLAPRRPRPLADGTQRAIAGLIDTGIQSSTNAQQQQQQQWRTIEQ